jgi:hypothetical protein
MLAALVLFVFLARSSCVAAPVDRRPQINFQVDPSMKMLYEEARANGHWVTRLCAAGLLLMVEDPGARRKALNRLIDWEADYAGASAQQIRAFVQGAQDSMRGSSQGSSGGRKIAKAKKKPKRGGAG